MYLGGGFGRRANPRSDFVQEAVQVAKVIGKPIKVVWAREDDMRGGYYRPMWADHIEAGIGKDGKPLAWKHTIVGQSIIADTPFEPMMIKNGIDATSVEGASTLPYLIPNLQVELHSTKNVVPVQWWRSVGHSHTAFVVETMIDELAHLAGKDPVAYRLDILPAASRYRGALKLATEKAGWGKTKLPAGHAYGVAVHKSFDSYVAQVAEVSLENGKIRVHRVIAAVDCGMVVNPDGVQQQIEGAIVYGLSAALHGEITLENGRVMQSNFDTYKPLRMSEMPQVEVHIVESSEHPSGIGEPGTPPIAPAVANAAVRADRQALAASAVSTRTPLPDRRPIAAIVLAAGGSRRFGSNKLLHPVTLNGETLPLAAHSLLPWLEIFDRVTVVVRPGSEAFLRRDRNRAGSIADRRQSAGWFVRTRRAAWPPASPAACAPTPMPQDG